MTNLVPNAFYWARSVKHNDGRLTVVEVSTIFGTSRDFWTLAVPGSDQHFMIEDFEILSRIEQPKTAFRLQAAE